MSKNPTSASRIHAWWVRAKATFMRGIVPSRRHHATMCRRSSFALGGRAPAGLLLKPARGFELVTKMCPNSAALASPGGGKLGDATARAALARSSVARTLTRSPMFCSSYGWAAA
jgi:hypothetical protein